MESSDGLAIFLKQALEGDPLSRKMQTHGPGTDLDRHIGALKPFIWKDMLAAPATSLPTGRLSTPPRNGPAKTFNESLAAAKPGRSQHRYLRVRAPVIKFRIIPGPPQSNSGTLRRSPTHITRE